MTKIIQIPISPTQKDLLQQEVSQNVVDGDVDRAISAILSKEGKYYICLDNSELEELIGTICFMANHEDDRSKLAKQLDELAEYLDPFLENCD